MNDGFVSDYPSSSLSVVTTGQRFRPRELPAEDAVTFVESGIRTMPQRYAVRVRMAADAAVVAEAVGHWGHAEPVDGGCVLTMNVDSLGWPLMVLAQLEADFEVEAPQKLQDLVNGTAERFGRAAAR